jgi:hypothetical protein
MVGKHVQFNDETFEAILAVARQRGRTFSNSPTQPVGLMAS